MFSFNNHFTRSISVMLLGLAIIQPSALATPKDSESISAALIAFELAIKDVNTRLRQYREKKQAITLIQTSEDKNGKIFQQEFIPQKHVLSKVQGIWKTLREDAEFNQSINVSNDILFESTNFNIEKAKLIEETHSSWIFRLPNNINIDSENDDDISNKDMMKIDEAVTNNIFTEIIIDKEYAKIKGLKIYTLASFNPSLLVTIEKFELRLSFDEAWPDGPIIRKNMTKLIVGKFGWFIDIDELVTTKVSNIRKIDLTKAEPSRG